MIALAAGPILLILGIKYVEGEDDLFIKASELLALDPDIPSARGSRSKIPEYEHDLLRKDWMPIFHCDEDDKDELEEAKVSNAWLKGLLSRPRGERGGR